MSRLESTIDLAVLDPCTKSVDIIKACQLAREHKMASVCVYPSELLFCNLVLAKSDVTLSTVIGFPFGNQATDIRCEEAKRAIDDGAQELDVVMRMSCFADKLMLAAMLDMHKIVEAADWTPVKVIIETGNWDKNGIVAASKMARDAGAAYVKTCTGFGPRGVTVEDIEIIKSAVDLPIKASGGIKTRQQAEIYVDLGCSRLGIGIGSIEKILK